MSIRPFSNGAQFGDWTASNCDGCTKSPDNGGKCDIFEAIGDGNVGDGTVSDEIGKRMGYDRAEYVWPCTEGEPTPERRARLAAKRAPAKEV